MGKDKDRKKKKNKKEEVVESDSTSDSGPEDVRFFEWTSVSICSFFMVIELVWSLWQCYKTFLSIVMGKSKVVNAVVTIIS